MRPVLLCALFLIASPAAAEVELGFYGGWAGAPDGSVTLGGEPNSPDTEETLDGGFGESGQAGVRATWWGGDSFGIALDYSRYGDLDEEAGSGLSFGGLETLTLGGVQRWEEALGGFTPYVGAGLGLAIADLEANGAGQVEATGPAVSWVAGASVPIGGNWSVFGEYEGTYADVEASTEGGGTLEADSVINSINLGVSFSF